MTNSMIAIFDYETDYSLKLAQYFNQKSGLTNSVCAFTDLQSLLSYQQKQCIEILLISEDIFSKDSSIFEIIPNIFVLTEEDMATKQDSIRFLYKYQSCEVILREVMTCYAGTPNLPKKSSTNLPAKIIGVYSPIRRCGKTSFSLAYGCLLSINTSCLYLNFEEYSGFSYFIENSSVGDLSDLLYFYRQTPFNLDKKLLALSHSFHNLNYILPMQFGYDIKNIDTTDLKTFIQAIAKSGNYQTLILDISDSIKDLPDFLEICDCIYMPTTKELISKYKTDEFFKNADSIHHNSLKDKIQLLHLPCADMEHLFFHSDKKDTSEFLNRLLFSELGKFIQNMMNQ